MAARIQVEINAPCKEKKRISSVTVEHVEQQSPEPASQPRPQGPELAQQEGFSATPELPPPCLEQRRNLSAAMVEAKPKTYSRRPRSTARSDDGWRDSDDSFSFTSFMHTDSETETNFPRARNNRSKRPRLDAVQRRSHTQSPHLTTEIASTVGANFLSESSTDITIPDIGSNNSNNNNNTNIDESSLSETDPKKQRLKLNLLRFLDNELDYAGILAEVIPLTRQLYATSPYQTPFSDLEVEFKNSKRALDH
jgi:hypothetical protein